MTKTFYTINPKQCLASYPTVLDNGARQFRIANILADQEEYGSAVSHLVLGAEELLKATALFMAGNKAIKPKPLLQMSGIKKPMKNKNLA